jgi:hypothetical protein
MGKITNIFQWLNEITITKSPSTSFTEGEWETYNNWLVTRFISFNPDYIELANMAQTIPPQNKQHHYEFLREFIPKRKSYFKYIKNKKEKFTKELKEHIATYFECSLKEASQYLNLLSPKEIEGILRQMGIEGKESKKLTKQKS